MDGIAYQNKDIASKVTGEALIGKNLGVFGLPHRMIVIYTADVEHANDVYDLGGIVIRLESAFLIHQDTEAICRELEDRISNKKMLTEEELILLMILPLTVKGTREKQEYIIKSVEMAKSLPDRVQTLRVLAGILTFTDKVINDEYRERIKEEMQMTKIGQMIFEDGLERGEKEKACKTAENMFVRGFTVEETAGIVEESISDVRKWFDEWNVLKQ